MIGPFQWVLRNARLHAADPDRRSAAGFVRGLEVGPHRAQVKRWENGQVALTHGLVRRYEDTLDLAEGQLLRAIDLMAREDNPLMSLPAIAAPVSPDIVAEAMPLLERALEYDVMTGLDWDRLTTLLGSSPHVLVRKRDWETLIYRLSSEAAISTGLEYAHRWEAAARMVSNHRTTDVVIEMIESALKDDDVQLYSDYSTLLRYCPDRRGHEVLADVIRNPPNPRALWASLSAATTLVRHGLLAAATLDDLVPITLQIVEDEGYPVRTRRAAASFAERADSGRATDRSGRRRPPLTPAQRATVDDLLTSSGLAPAQQEGVFDATLAALVSDTPTDARDEVLHSLVRMALREPHIDTRDTALGVLMLSPQGHTLGDVLAVDLRTAVDEADTFRAVGDLSILSWLVGPSALETLTDLTTGVVGAPELASLAGAALGNCAEPPGPAREARDALLAAYAREQLGVLATSGDERVPATNAWGVSYALGMRGRFDLIADLLTLLEAGRDRDHPEWATSLSWWVALPEVIRPKR
ncbi:MAG: hypothetical protein ABI890_06275, partial [Lapillicoccus sp.]